MSLKSLQSKGTRIEWKAWRMPEGAAPPAKPEGYGQQAKEELTRLLTKTGLAIQPPSAKSDTFLAHVGAKVAKDKGAFDQYHQRVFELIWVEDQNIEDADILTSMVKTIGLDPNEFREALQEERYEQMVFADYHLADQTDIWTIPVYVGERGSLQVHHFKDIPSEDELEDIF